MGTKTKYKSKEIVKEIEEKKRQFSGETKVIYCVDTDQYRSNADHQRELAEISNYCAEHQYDFVWFCQDIEDVYWGEEINDGEKVKVAGQFRAKKMIETMEPQKLKGQRMNRHYSNITLILDQYLNRH